MAGRCDDINLEWRIADVERQARAGSECAQSLYSVRSDVDSMERAMRETRSEIDELRHELSQIREEIERTNQRIELMEYPNE